MKYLIISGSLDRNRKAILWEKIGCQGNHTMVPVYQAELGDDTRPNTRFRFGVIRDAAQVVFGHETKRYIAGGECPPHRTCVPYRGIIEEKAPRNGWCLRLFEPGLGNHYSLKGQGEVLRSHILIHKGPSSSLGCMSVAGCSIGFLMFRQALERILSPGEELLVFVEPRPQSHHDMHLTPAG